MIDKFVGVGEMMFQCPLQCGQSFLVKAEQQFLRRGVGEDFIEENFQRGMWNDIEAERRFTHLTDTDAQCARVFGAHVRV